MADIIYGFHSISPVVWKTPELIGTLYCEHGRTDKRVNELIAEAQERNISVELVNKTKLDKIAQTNKHQGVVAELNEVTKKDLSLKSTLKELEGKSDSIIVVLDGVTDPHNLGAIIRSCDCFGVDAVVLPKDNSANINATVAKVSSGAINNVPVIVVNNISRALDEIKDYGYWIAGTTLADNSVELFDFKPDNKIVWVLGSEGSGIRRLVAENCDHLVSIPMYGGTQSLNVSVAAGVVLSYTQFMKNKKVN
jgi:23S rRNA (guanosine2251-2'-O)-methyltransferase